MKFAIGAMSIGDVLDRSLKILLARFPQFFVVNFVCQAPFMVLIALVPVLAERAAVDEASAGSVVAFAAIGTIVGIVLYILMIQLATAATLRIVLDEYAGRASSIGEAFSFAFSRLMPLLGTSILSSLVIMGAFVLLILPSIYAAVALLFVSQVVVLETLSGAAALKRSHSLVKGHWWRIFGAAILIYIVIALIEAGRVAILTYFWPAMEPHQAQIGNQVITYQRMNPNVQAIQTIVTSPIPIILQTYWAIGLTLLYLDLRIRKEAFDLELAAASDNPAEVQ
jgi:hypothetical protein